MTNIKEQTIPTAYSREVNVESTLKYMGEVITFLVLGNALVFSGLANFPFARDPLRMINSLTHTGTVSPPQSNSLRLSDSRHNERRDSNERPLA